jgi:hypothetical protein
MNLNLNKRDVLIITGVEVVFGLIEGIVIPNVLSKEKGWVIPDKKQILESAVTLTITGFLSGLAAEWAINKYELSATDPRRPYFIAGAAVAINVAEAILLPNIVGKKFDKDYKFELPKFRIFAGTMLVLTLTALAGGYTANTIIAAANANSGSSTENIAMVSPK